MVMFSYQSIYYVFKQDIKLNYKVEMQNQSRWAFFFIQTIF